MSVTGRDVQYEEYPLIFDKDCGKWMRQGDSYELFAQKFELEAKRMEYMISNTRKTIMKLLEENSGVWQGRCNMILDKSKEYGMPITLTSQKLGKGIVEITGFLFEDGVTHTEISKGKASSIHKFEKV